MQQRLVRYLHSMAFLGDCGSIATACITLVTCKSFCEIGHFNHFPALQQCCLLHQQHAPAARYMNSPCTRKANQALRNHCSFHILACDCSKQMSMQRTLWLNRPVIQRVRNRAR
jgi:hypothetical protein